MKPNDKKKPAPKPPPKSAAVAPDAKDPRDLKDQLKDWKKSQPAPPPAAKAAAKKSVIARPPPSKTDAELFADAVSGVDRDAVLKKYDEAPPPPAPKRSVEEKRIDDEKLFEQFVGDVAKNVKKS